jgi:hypothetical protein
MITNISRQLNTRALAVASLLAAFGFAAPAQAQLAGTLSITGTADIDPWGTPDPMLKPLNVTAINGATGQFAGVMLNDVSTPLGFALSGAPGSMPMHMFDSDVPPSIANFISILVNQTPPGAGTVIGNVTSTMAMGTFAGISTANTTTYTVTGTMTFDEPNGYPDLLGTFSIGFTRSVVGTQISEGYTLSLQKSGAPVSTPEPSAILGVLAVAGAGAFARRKS